MCRGYGSDGGVGRRVDNDGGGRERVTTGEETERVKMKIII